MAGILPVLSSILLLVAPAVLVAQTNVPGFSPYPNATASALPNTSNNTTQDNASPSPAHADSSALTTSQIGVNAGQPVRTANPCWFGIGTPIWDNYLGTPQTLTMLSNMGVQALRFPGGSVADQYHWVHNIDSVGQYYYQESVASFIQVATNANAQTMITVNYGDGTPSEAAAWVAYVNATTNNPQYLGVDSHGTDWQTAGHWASLRASAPLAMDDGMNFLRISRAEPLGLKYWEIGNEVYGFWENDVNYLSHDPYTYAVRCQQYISLMKAVDPTIKIGVVASSGVNSYVNNTFHPALDPVTQQIYYGWTPVLLATLAGLGVTPDFAIFHMYPEDPGFESDAALLNNGNGWSTWTNTASDLRTQINDFMGASGTNIELICTENNSDVANPGKQSVSLVNGLYKADTLGQLMQTEFNGLFWHDFRDGVIETTGNMSPSLYGWRMFGDFGVATETVFYPAYYTTELIRHFAQGGDTVVAAASDDSLLSVYAVRRLDGSLTVLAVNKDPINTNTAQVWVSGFTPASRAAVYSYGITQDTAAQTGIGSQDILQTNIVVTGTSFGYSFPPYSATVIVLSPAPTIGPSTTTLASSQNPALAGGSVTLAATVRGSVGVATGFVVFNDGTTNLGTGTLNAGVATLTTATLSAGGLPHSITAVYSGDSYFAGSSSSALLQAVTNKVSVTTNGLIASWPFSEGYGATVSDSSGNGNTGTLEDSPTWTNGLNGSHALAFPGSLVPGSAYVSVPASATLADQGTGSNITICAWVKRSAASLGNYSAVVAKDIPFDVFPYHRNYELIFDTEDRILFLYRNSAGTSWEMYASTQFYTDTNNWHYYCVTYTYGNASSCTLYVDGAAVSGSWVVGNGSDAPVSTSGGPVLIGIDGAGSASYGSIYQGISIYSTNLPAPQLLALYNSRISTGLASTTALASSQNPASGGTAVTFTAAVSGSGGTPTGTVVFFDGNNNLGSQTLNSAGIASLSTGALSVKGSIHSIVAVYDGGGGFAASSSSVLSQVFTVGSTTTTVSSSQNPAVAGSAVTFTATVSGGDGPPAGSVVFYDGTDVLSSGTLNGSGVASFSTSALSVSGSPHSITAAYSGGGLYSASASGALSQTVTPAPSATTISSSQNPALTGSTVTFTATVSGGAGIPSGTVAFYDGPNNLGSGTLNGSGIASVSTGALSVGGSPHSITAAYGGNGTYAGSTSAVLLETIANVDTNSSSYVLSASWPFSEGSGKTVADSSGNGNTGTLVNSPLWVSGLAGHNALQFPGSSAVTAGYVSVPNSATLADQGIGSQITICAWVKRSSASVGKYCSVVAKDVLYDGLPYHRNYELIFDTGNHILFVYRNSAGTSWEMYSSAAVFADTANWHFYSVTYTYGAASSCTLYVDGVPVAGGWIAGNGSDAPASTSGGPVLIGTDGTGTASNGSIYDDISVFNGILSASQIFSLYAGGISGGVVSTTALTSSQNPAAAGSAVTFTATVSGSGGTPTGTVAFDDGTNILGSGTLNSSGIASFSISALSASGSPHSMTAVYGGDGTYGGSASVVISEVITNSGSTTTSPGGLSANWLFSEGSGKTVADSSGNGNTGTLVNSPLWVSGLAGHNALEFSGSSAVTAGYVSVPNSATLADQGLGSNITICAWVKRSSASLGKYCSIIAKAVPGDGAYHRNYELIFDTGNHILFVFGNSAGTSWEMYSSAAVFADTANWHFYSVTYTYGAASSCTLYMDGVPVAGGWVAGNGSDAPASTSGGPVLIGIDGAGTVSYGNIYDDISIYNGVLSASQVLTLYNTGISGGVASMTALTSSQDPAATGSTVTFTATVSGSGGTPTGTVAFDDGTNILGSGTLNSSGIASFSISALSASGSPHSMTAVYGGDGTYGGSASVVISEVITNSGSTTTSPGGLSANWLFSEGSGKTVADSSGNGNTGTLVNSPLWVSGLAGHNALEFSGSSAVTAGYVSVPNSATLADQGLGSNITICAWVKRSAASVGNYCSVVAKDVLNDGLPYRRNYELIFDNVNHISFVYRNSTGTSWEVYSSSAAYADTANWHFYSVTYTYGAASSCTLYVDGVPVAGGWVAGNGSDAPASTSGGLVLIGTDGTGTASNGSIYDDISIYNGILSASQVLALYTSGTSSPDALLVSTSLTLPQVRTGDAAFGFLNSQFGCNIAGAAGHTIVVEGSADLVNWTPLCTNIVTGNVFYFSDPASANLKWRFYRARLP